MFLEMLLKRARGVSSCTSELYRMAHLFYVLCIFGALFLESELAGTVETVGADFALR